MPDSGWIKLHRKMLTGQLWSLSDSVLRVATYLLLSANHEPRYWRGIEIKSGQTIRSQRTISEDCKMCRATVQTALKQLEKIEFIKTRKTLQKHQIITVCNWEVYQGGGLADSPLTSPLGSPVTSPLTSPEQELEERKNKKKKTPLPPIGGILDDPEFDNLNFPAFRESFHGWIDMRKAKKTPPTERAVRLVLKKCLAWGPVSGAQQLDESTENNWSGVFPPKQGNNGSQQQKPKVVPTYRELMEGTAR